MDNVGFVGWRTSGQEVDVGSDPAGEYAPEIETRADGILINGRPCRFSRVSHYIGLRASEHLPSTLGGALETFGWVLLILTIFPGSLCALFKLLCAERLWTMCATGALNIFFGGLMRKLELWRLGITLPNHFHVLIYQEMTPEDIAEDKSCGCDHTYIGDRVFHRGDTLYEGPNFDKALNAVETVQRVADIPCLGYRLSETHQKAAWGRGIRGVLAGPPWTGELRGRRSGTGIEEY